MYAFRLLDKFVKKKKLKIFCKLLAMVAAYGTMGGAPKTICGWLFFELTVGNSQNSPNR